MIDTTPSQIVAGEVRAQMARKRLGQGALAELIERSQASASRRLLGHTPFDVNELFVIADFLNLDVCDLLKPAMQQASA